MPVTRLLLVLATLLACLVGCDNRSTKPSVAAQATPAQAEPAPASQPIEIDVYTDLVCPWCFIGTEVLDRAIEKSSVGPRVVLRHKSFLLNPDTPAEGIDVVSYLREKTGREPTEMFSRVEGVAQRNGIALDLSKQPRMYRTIHAHALLRNAENRGTQRALERAFFRAYFVEGKDLTDMNNLVAIAAQHGFTEEEARRIANDPAELDAVRAEAREASMRGVRGVPFFVFPDGRTLSGAQPEEAFRAALEQAASASPSASP